MELEFEEKCWERGRREFVSGTEEMGEEEDQEEGPDRVEEKAT